MLSVADREITGPALGSGAEDTFWVLVCEDEEWLRAEFDAIVSEPTETPTPVTDQPGIDNTTERHRAAGRWRGPLRRWRVGDRPERHLVRERAPPKNPAPHHSTLKRFLPQ